MLKFVLRKMMNKKWMVLSLLIGNLLLVSITCSNPMYTKAVLQRMLQTDLATYLQEKNTYPGTITLKAGSTASRNQVILDLEEVVAGIPEKYGVEAKESVEYLYLTSTSTEPRLVREDAEGKNMTVAALSDLPEHIELIAGEMYSSQPDEEGIVDVIVSERALIYLNLLMGEVIDIPQVTMPDGSYLSIRIAGVFKNSQADDVYWVRSPSYYTNICFMDYDLFRQCFADLEKPVEALNAIWYVLLDFQQMRGDEAAHMLATTQEYSGVVEPINGASYRTNFDPILTEYMTMSKKVTVTMWVLQVPIFVLLAAFIFMVSRQMLDMEQNEIAVIKSRGAGKGQILSIYTIQSMILASVGFGGGIFLGAYLCQVLGSANSFLEFVKRSSLDVEITQEALLFAGAAALLSVAAMVIPVIRYSKVTIVSHKQKKNRKGGDRPMWQKMYLDIAVLGLSLYGLYSYNSQKDILAQRVLEGASLDPVLFLSSSLFMIGAGLLALRIIPALVWVIFTLFKKWWSPALYASFLRVLRTRQSQGFIMVFLILTIALGVFNAQAARTINSNEEDNIYYSVGADVVLQEEWANNGEMVKMDPSMDLVYNEPDFGRYADIEGVESAAKVFVNTGVTASVSGGSVKNVQLMAIDTKEFGETLWLRDGLNPYHINEYLNAISQNARAVLVSRNFQTNYKLKLGDVVSYKNADGDSLYGIIHGFVDYFPSYAPVTYSKGSDGLFKETENYLIVAHLSQVQSEWGITPYQVWLKVNGSTRPIYEFAQNNQVTFTMFEDTSEKIVQLKNDPVFQGTNGILTVGFIVVLLLCAVGFLIYWILSIQSRALQFGIFRAMGMSMREVLTMLINEHVFISGLSLATGAVVGRLTAWLYMPLIQMAYAASDSSVPLTVVTDSTDMIRIAIIVGVMLVICLGILGMLISRMKIAQALKLGED